MEDNEKPAIEEQHYALDRSRAEAYLSGYEAGNNDCDDKIAFQKGYIKGYNKGHYRSFWLAWVSVMIGAVLSRLIFR